MQTRCLGLLIVIVTVSFVPSGSRAAPDEGPWADGVSEERRGEAERLLAEGNALFLERRHADALELYRRALELWDHPGIHFNVVRCLIHLDRPVEAADALERALAYGDAPLQTAVYEEALGYQKLLANQVGELIVECTEPGIELTLDGRALGTCPTTEHRRVAPGTRQVVGAKRGFQTRTARVTVFGGKRERVAISLIPLERAGTIAHRWPVRVPWIVLGSGAGVAAVGGLVQWKSATDMATFDRAVRRECRVTGCVTEGVDVGLRTRAERENRIAIGLLVVGAAGAAIGGTMLYLNRARTVYPIIDVAPGGGASIAIGGGF